MADKPEVNWTDRIDPVGQNGNTGEHYEEVSDDDWEQLDFFDDIDLGTIDPDSYQEQDDSGCEGGGCKI